MWHVWLIALTGASSYSHEGPSAGQLRSPKMMGKDKAAHLTLTVAEKAGRRDDLLEDGLDLENATSAWMNQQVVCEMERQRAPWQPLPVPEATRCLDQGTRQMCSPASKPTVPFKVVLSAHCSTAVLNQLVRTTAAAPYTSCNPYAHPSEIPKKPAMLNSPHDNPKSLTRWTGQTRLKHSR